MYFRTCIRTLPSNATMPVLTNQFNLFVELPNDLLLPIIEGSMNVGQRLAPTYISAHLCGMPECRWRFESKAICHVAPSRVEYSCIPTLLGATWHLALRFERCKDERNLTIHLNAHLTRTRTSSPRHPRPHPQTRKPASRPWRAQEAAEARGTHLSHCYRAARGIYECGIRNTSCFRYFRGGLLTPGKGGFVFQIRLLKWNTEYMYNMYVFSM